MANYFSGFSSRVANLRQNLLAGESDGQTPQETNIARVLRSYYTEQGRTFNPPESHLNIYSETAPQPVQAVYTPTPQAQGQQRPYQPASGGKKLGDLFAPQPQGGASPSAGSEAGSLRTPRGGPRQPVMESRNSDGYSNRNRREPVNQMRSNSYDNQQPSYNSQPNYAQPSRTERPYPGSSQQGYGRQDDYGGGGGGYSAPPPANNYGPPKNAGARRPAVGLPSGPKGGLPMGGPRGRRN